MLSLHRWSEAVSSIRGRRYVVCLSLLILSISLAFSIRFPSSTYSSMPPPTNSRTHKADQAFAKAFPNLKDQVALLFLLQCQDAGHSCCKYSPSALRSSYCQPQISSLQDFILNSASSFPAFVALDSYASFSERNLTLVADQYISSDNRTMSFVLQYRHSESMELPIWFSSDEAQAGLRRSIAAGLSVGVTGMEMLLEDVVQTSASDMFRVDRVSLPLALVIMAFLVGNVFLLAIPLLVLGMAVSSSFAIMYLVNASGLMRVSSMAPSTMMSLIVALSIDYTLFLLVRFREEQRKRPHGSLRQSVIASAAQTGRVVLTSGTTLAFSFLLLCLFGVNVLQSMGIGAAIAIFCTMASSLSLAPALISYMAKPVDTWTNALRNRSKRLFFTSNSQKEGHHHQPSSSADIDTTISSRQRRSLWFKAATWSMSFGGLCTCVLLTCIIFVALLSQAIHLQHTTTVMQMFPRDSVHLSVMEQAEASLGAGALGPFRLLQIAPVYDKDAWKDQQKLVSQLISSGLIDASGIHSVSSFGHIPISVFESKLMRHWAKHPPPSLDPAKHAMVVAYAYEFEQLVNEQGTASMIMLQTQYDPFADTAVVLVQHIRALIDERKHNQMNGHIDNIPAVEDSYSYHLSAAICGQVDAVDDIYTTLPICLAMVSIMVFVFLAVEFHSLLIPLRAIVSISFSITCVYGIAVIFFQGFFLSFTAKEATTASLGSWIAPSVFGSVSSMFWISPVIAFPVMIGLALDYDIFLMERVRELRLKGFSDKASIQRAVFHTGSSISGAGSVMIVAFAGMTLSHINAIVEIGFLLATAVFLDTFLVRTLLVPAMNKICGVYIWWPGHVPIAYLSVDDPEPIINTAYHSRARSSSSPHIPLLPSNTSSAVSSDYHADG